MTRIHTVEQGECLSSIARRYGLASWQTIYNHPDNEDFRKLRENPNIIQPGDRVAIPDPEPKSLDAPTQNRNRYRVGAEPTYLRLNVLRDIGGEGSTGRYVLEVEGLSEPMEGELGDRGAIDVVVPASASRARLRLFDAGSGACVETLNLHIGELDPVDELSGVQARLNALCFDCGPVDGRWGPKTERGVRRFQRSLDIADDAERYGQATLDRLVEIYGS
jgi:N-acetylmuramoyl-L-alanine amidase